MSSIEHQHSARDFAGLHRAKGVVDVLEAAAAGLNGGADAGPLREPGAGLARIAVGAFAAVGGAAASGHPQLSVDHAAAEDLPRAADARARPNGQPDAAAAEHGDRLARLE